MARFRPVETGGGGNFGGFMEAQIVDYSDRTEEFDWADLFIDVTMQVPTSQYPVIYNLKGSYEKENDGKIKSCTLLNKIYYLLDAIGCKGGPNVNGEWEDEDGKKIDKIDTYLNQNFLANNPLTNENYPYCVYVYKEWIDSKDKAYTRVCPKIVMNTEKGIADLKSYVAFLKQKNIIKEYNGEARSSLSKETATSQSSDSSVSSRLF